MNVVLLYAHPNPDSYDASLAKKVEKELSNSGASVKFKDLYAMKFNPVLSQADFNGYHSGYITSDIKQEQQDIASADLIIMIAPIWWYSVPAILKGYIDRVFSIGFAYKFAGSKPEGLLKGKKAMLITTSGDGESAVELTGKTFGEIFAFSGIGGFRHHNLSGVPNISEEHGKQMLDEVGQLVKTFFPNYAGSHANVVQSHLH